MNPSIRFDQNPCWEWTGRKHDIGEVPYDMAVL
jgi:hypothetical protein